MSLSQVSGLHPFLPSQSPAVVEQSRHWKSAASIMRSCSWSPLRVRTVFGAEAPLSPHSTICRCLIIVSLPDLFQLHQKPGGGAGQLARRLRALPALSPGRPELSSQQPSPCNGQLPETSAPEIPIPLASAGTGTPTHTTHIYT